MKETNKIYTTLAVLRNFPGWSDPGTRNEIPTLKGDFTAEVTHNGRAFARIAKDLTLDLQPKITLEWLRFCHQIIEPHVYVVAADIQDEKIKMIGYDHLNRAVVSDENGPWKYAKYGDWVSLSDKTTLTDWVLEENQWQLKRYTIKEKA